jgi:hypothetical protein
MDVEWVPLSQAVKRVAERLETSIGLAQLILQRQAFPAGVRVRLYEVSEVPHYLQRIMGRSRDASYYMISAQSLSVAEIDWEGEKMITGSDYGTCLIELNAPYIYFQQLQVNVPDLEAWLKQNGAEPAKHKRSRRTHPRDDAEVRRKIEAVVKHWREWPASKRAKSERQQAGLLYEELKGKVELSESAFRAILRGKYPPMIRLRIPKPRAG